MTRRPDEDELVNLSPRPPTDEALSPDADDTSDTSDTDEGMLDLDDHDQINNQHLEVR